MTILQAFIMGLVQGVTEFLPISSSGHLLLLEKVWHMQTSGLLFVTLLHVGTLVAVLWALRKEVRWLLKRPFSWPGIMILVALVPTAIIGVLFEEWFEDLFHTGATIGLEFVITGVVLWWMDSVKTGDKEENTMRVPDALWIGALQGAAILPALSRSGLTIAGGLWRGMTREAAGRFSFLLSIPAILGGLLVELDDLFEEPGQLAHIQWLPILVGTLAALVFGYLAVKGTLWLIQRCKMRYFAVYTWALAAFILSDQLFFHHWFSPLFH